jgi:DNA-binding beta-propeller fold protein YncE
MAWPAVCGLLMALTLGCGNRYLPVVTPINPTGPAGQPTAYVAVTSEPNYNLLDVPQDNPCIVSASSDPSTTGATPYPEPGVATIVDFSGDSIAAQALIGNGPIITSMDPTGGLAYAPNCDGTISSFLVSSSLQTKNVYTSTLLNYPTASANAIPYNILAMSGTIFAVEKGHNAIAEMSSAQPPALVQEIPVAPDVINLVGINRAQRIYSISQGNSGTGPQPAWGDCSNPSSVTTDGEADGIDLSVSGTSNNISIANQTVSSRIPVGVCPVYGVMSSNGERAFILNRGSGTISVIDAQKNALDSPDNTATGNPDFLSSNGTINLCGGVSPCNAGPVFAEIYDKDHLLVTANYDNNTISVIDISQDVYGNDSPTFGKVLATVHVGVHPAALTILQDGSRVYVADQGTTSSSGGATTYNDDGGVTIVSLKSYAVEKTIPLNSNPRMIQSIYNYPEGKVYVASPNSPFLTVIRTDTDIIATQIEVQGNITGISTSTQYAGASASAFVNNNDIQSHAPGSGEP